MRARADLHHLHGHRADYVRDRARRAAVRLAAIDRCTDAELAEVVCAAISDLRAAEDELCWLAIP